MTKLKNKFVPTGILYQGYVYRKPEWAINQVIKQHGFISDVCHHNVDHPNEDYLEINPHIKGFHACCGCCDVDFSDSEIESL